MSTHTPGPWRVSNRAGSGYGKEFIVYTPKGAAFIGDQLAPDGVSIAEARANATLAAKAPVTPKLADALRPILAAWDSLKMERVPNALNKREMWDAARTALAEWDAQS